MKEYIIKIGDEPDIMGNYGLKEKPKELVRCKDCWKREFDNCPFNEWADVILLDDFFCADGERKGT